MAFQVSAKFALVLCFIVLSSSSVKDATGKTALASNSTEADDTAQNSTALEYDRLSSARRQLQDYYRLEGLRELRLRPMSVAMEQTRQERDQMGVSDKSGHDSEHLVAFWVFSCSRINNCIAITALGITFLCMSFTFFMGMLWYRLRKTKTFSPDEWWCEQHQQTRQPLLLVDRSMLKEEAVAPQEQQINAEELHKLKKYLKKYMSMNARSNEPKLEVPKEPKEEPAVAEKHEDEEVEKADKEEPTAADEEEVVEDDQK